MLDWSVGVPDVGAATHPSRGTTPQNGAAWEKPVGTVNFSNAETEELRELGGIRIARLRPLGNKRPGVAEFIGFVGRQAIWIIPRSQKAPAPTGHMPRLSGPSHPAH
jgi:hypothetical protein